MSTVLVARLDNAGDVLLAGPAVRAVAAHVDKVVMLTGPHGTAAAELLPGVDAIIEWCAPWIDPDPAPVTATHVAALHDAVRAQAPGAAVLLTSFHQSALPLALLLRLAGVGWIGAISEDYPGSLLDLRHHVDGDPPEAQRGLGLVHAAGYPLPPGDDGRLAVRRPLPDVEPLTGRPGYVVVHPGASVPAREWPARHCTRAVRALVAAGHRVVVTGSIREQHLTALVAGDRRYRPRRPHRPAHVGCCARRRMRGRRRQHRTGASGCRGGHTGGVAVRTGGAGRAVGTLRGTDGTARRPARTLPRHPGAALPRARSPVPVGS